MSQNFLKKVRFSNLSLKNFAKFTIVLFLERCAISGTITNTEVETRVPKKSEAKKDTSYLPMLPKKPSKELVPAPENSQSGEKVPDKRPTR